MIYLGAYQKFIRVRGVTDREHSMDNIWGQNVRKIIKINEIYKSTNLRSSVNTRQDIDITHKHNTHFGISFKQCWKTKWKK